MSDPEDSSGGGSTPRLAASSAETLYSSVGERSSGGPWGDFGPVAAATASPAEDERGRFEASDPTAMLQRGFRVGRFTVLELLGKGGMGVVFSAYDDILDRRVALKLVHERRADARWQARILREAKALARLSHPNVVQIYEAGEFGQKIYLAMELIQGGTLREWLRGRAEAEGDASGDGATAPARPVYQEVLRCFESAGRGLAAAHRVGLVHRDFKPDNVLVGEDGRVYVVDFGLVSGVEVEADEEAMKGLATSVLAERLRALDPDLTQEGAIMGTVSYMSPEQLDGRPSTALSDQFSFCVALYEALHGARPFTGATVEAIRGNISANHRAAVSERREVPPHVRSAIERGLAIDPSARWPSIEELLDVLARDPSRRRRRLLGWTFVAILVVSSLLGYQALERHENALCLDRGEVAVDEWAEARPSIEGVFLGTDSPIREDTWSRVDDVLSTWAGEWSEARADACLAVRRREDFAPRREVCLERQAVQFRGLISALEEIDKEGVGNAVRAAGKLPRVARCQSANLLLLAVESEADGTGRGGADTARAQLARARGFLYTGGYSRGREIVDEVLAAGQGAIDDAVRAEALLLRARFLRKAGDFERAREEARGTFFLAGRIGHDRVATEASIVLLGITGADLGEAGGVERWKPLAEMLLARLGLDRESLAGTYHLTLGAGYRRSGAYHEAEQHYQLAREIYAATLGPSDPALAQVENNLGILREAQGDKEGALVHLARGLELVSVALGADHPEVAMYLGNIGTTYMLMGEFERSIEYILRALEIEERIYDDNHPQIGFSLHTLSTAQEQLGRNKEARAGYQRAAKIFEKHYGKDHEYVFAVILGMANIAWSEGDREEALAGYERVVEHEESLEGAKTEDRASALFTLAEALGDMEREPARARALAEKALELYRSMGEYTPPAADNVARWLELHPAP